MSDRLTLGLKLQIEANRQRLTAADIVALYPRYKEDGAVLALRADMIQRTFDGGGSLGCARAVAIALRKKIAVKGWGLAWKAKDSTRIIDIASQAGLCELTTRSAVRALNDWSLAPDSILVETLECVLFTRVGCEIVLEEV